MFKDISIGKIVKTLGFAALAVIAYLFLAMLFTGWYTRHGQSVQVPKIEGMPAENAFAALDEKGLEMEIIDSVYKEDQKPMTIVEQDPQANMSVKPGRTIYVVVNSGIKPRVKMPLLTNGSANLAKVLLQNAGLRLGRVDSVRSSFGSGLVIRQKYKGRDIEANTMLEKGSIIDIVVSKKMSHIDTSGAQTPPVGTDPGFEY